MSLIAPQDAAFLLGETAAQPTHVAGLAVYELPPDTGPDYVSQLYYELRGVWCHGLRRLRRKKDAGGNGIRCEPRTRWRSLDLPDNPDHFAHLHRSARIGSTGRLRADVSTECRRRS